MSNVSISEKDDTISKIFFRLLSIQIMRRKNVLFFFIVNLMGLRLMCTCEGYPLM